MNRVAGEQQAASANAFPLAKRQHTITDGISDEPLSKQLPSSIRYSSSPDHSAGFGSNLASSDEQSAQSYVSESSQYMSSDLNFEAFHKLQLPTAGFVPRAAAPPQSIAALYHQQHPTASQQLYLGYPQPQPFHISMQQQYSHGGGCWQSPKHKFCVISEPELGLEIEAGSFGAQPAISQRSKIGGSWAFEDRRIPACNLNPGLVQQQIEGQGLADSHGAAVVDLHGGGLYCGPELATTSADHVREQEAYLSNLAHRNSLKTSVGDTGSAGCQMSSLGELYFNQRLSSSQQQVPPQQLALGSPPPVCNRAPPSLVSSNRYGINTWTGSTELLLLPRIENAAVASTNGAVYGSPTHLHLDHPHLPYNHPDNHFHPPQQHAALQPSTDTLPLSAAAAHTSSLHHNQSHVAFAETRQTPGVNVMSPTLNIASSLDRWDKALDMALGRSNNVARMDFDHGADELSPTSFPGRPRSPGLSLFLSSQRQRPSTSIAGFDSGSLGVLRSSRYLRAAQQLLEEFCSVARGIPAKEEVVVPPAWVGSAAAGRADQQQSGNSEPRIQPAHLHHAGASTTTASAAAPSADAERSNCPTSKQLPAEERCHIQVRKARLIAMIEELDRRYRLYREQMQLVITSLESATGLGAAAPYTALARRAMSKHFRGLRDAIGGHIREACTALGEDVGSVPILSRGETPRLRLLDQRLRHHRSLQQIGLLQHQAWRPQRGLPERSVSVLRAWLFEHFLYPYPKDNDKLMLARLTGLTRNQVSNWFINARVRLWKPMVEEMYNIEESKELEGEATLSLDVQDQSHHHHQNGGGGFLQHYVGASSCALQEEQLPVSFRSNHDGGGDIAKVVRPTYYDGDMAGFDVIRAAEYAECSDEATKTIQQLQLAALHSNKHREYRSCAVAPTGPGHLHSIAAPGLTMKEAGVTGGSYVIQAPVGRYHVMNDNMTLPDAAGFPHDPPQVYATGTSSMSTRSIQLRNSGHELSISGSTNTCNTTNVKNCVSLTLGLQHSNSINNTTAVHNNRAGDQHPQSTGYHINSTSVFDRSWAS